MRPPFRWPSFGGYATKRPTTLRRHSKALNAKASMNQLSVKIDLEDYSAGLLGYFEANGFKGFGEGWFNISDIVNFCHNLKQFANSLDGQVELVAGQSKSDGSEYLERFGLRFYALSKSGILGVHVNLTEHPYTGCRPEEVSRVSGEIKIELQSALKFAQDLHRLALGELSEVTLVGKE